jgi:hypothetical protein
MKVCAHVAARSLATGLLIFVKACGTLVPALWKRQICWALCWALSLPAGAP